jgi:hypothetical protein
LRSARPGSWSRNEATDTPKASEIGVFARELSTMATTPAVRWLSRGPPLKSPRTRPCFSLRIRQPSSWRGPSYVRAAPVWTLASGPCSPLVQASSRKVSGSEPELGSVRSNRDAGVIGRAGVELQQGDVGERVEAGPSIAGLQVRQGLDHGGGEGPGLPFDDQVLPGLDDVGAREHFAGGDEEAGPPEVLPGMDGDDAAPEEPEEGVGVGGVG